MGTVLSPLSSHAAAGHWRGGRFVQWRRAVDEARLPEWPIVRTQLLTAAELDAELARPGPILLGVSEIAGLLGTTRNRAWQVTRKADFPRPLADLAGGPVWALPMVARFLEEWPRRRGPAPGSKRSVGTGAGSSPGVPG